MKEGRKPIKLAKSEIEALPVEAASYFCPVITGRGQTIQGLNVRVLPSGLKIFVHRYRHHGQQKILTLGRYPAMTPDQAKDASQEAQAKINAGHDPNQAKTDARKAAAVAKVAAFTVSELAEKWLDEHVKPNRSDNTIRMYEWITRQYVIPQLGKLAVQDVTPPMLAAFLAKIRNETAHTSNRARSVLSAMFAKAELWGFRSPGTNPARGQDKAPEQKRERRLSEPEIVLLGKVLRGLEAKEAPEILLAIRLILLTGMRKEEVLSLPWSAVNLEDGIIRLTEHKTKRKIGTRIVYLCSAAVGLLEKQNRMLGNPFVIPGAKTGACLVNLNKPWSRVQEAASRYQEENRTPSSERLDISDVTIHDLRRTFAGVGTDLDYPELITGALLGHAAGTVTAGYARAGSSRLQEVVEDIGGRIADLLAGKVDLKKEAEERRAAKARRNAHAG